MKPLVALALAAAATGVPPTGVGTHPGGVVSGGGTLRPGPGHRLAAFSRGCFWGTEARFRAIPGVVATAVGYMGGTEESPTYESIHARRTGHVETVLVEYDPLRVGYERLLDAFRDARPGSRSVVWTFDPEQAEASGARFGARSRPASVFWLAEERHQRYNERNGLACPI